MLGDPASMTPTVTSVFSVKRAATTRPAVPPPTMTKSKSCDNNSSVERRHGNTGASDIVMALLRTDHKIVVLSGLILSCEILWFFQITSSCENAPSTK